MFNPRWMTTLLAAACFAAFTPGCATAPKSEPERQSLQAEADAAIQSMKAKDSSLGDFLNRSAGYAMFPSVGKAGFVAGGAYGRGVLYEDGRPTGYVDLKQGSVGAQIGAQTYNELVVFENENALGRLKNGDFEFGGNVSAVALKAGVGGAAHFVNGVAVIIQPKGGLMAEASITGQKLNFVPLDEASTTATTRSSGSSSHHDGHDVDVKVETR